ncbi:Fatty acyl-CoA reductase 1, partial [Stegodyphus mimosarum]
MTWPQLNSVSIGMAPFTVDEGWVDNFNGPTGLIVATSKGILRSMHCKSSSIADLIPVDVVINLVITVAWYTASHRPNSIMVYNCSSGSINKVTWGAVEQLAIPLILRHPSHEIFRYPNGSFTNSKIWNYLSVMLYHHIPAYFIDLVAVLTGHKPNERTGETISHGLRICSL